MRTNIEAICAAVVLVLASGGAYGCSCSVREGGLWGSSSPIIFHAKILATQLTSEKKDLGEVVTARFEIVELTYVETALGDESPAQILRKLSANRRALIVYKIVPVSFSIEPETELRGVEGMSLD